MDESTKPSDVTKFPNKRYEALGEFIASYEFMTETMRGAVVAILQEDGLRNSRLGLALTARMYASDLHGVLLSLLFEWFNKYPDAHLKRVMHNALDRAQQLFKKRNNMAHGFTWSSGDEKDDDRMGFKWEHTKQGLKTIELPSLVTLEEHTKEARAVSSIMDYFYFAVHFPDGRASISQHFRFNDGGDAYYDPYSSS
jgi:hypothetical protein